MRTSPERLMKVGFFVVIALTLMISRVSIQAPITFGKMSAWVSHTEEVRAELARTDSQITGANLSTFVYTVESKRARTDRIQHVRSGMIEQIRYVAKLTADNEHQQTRLQHYRTELQKVLDFAGSCPLRSHNDLEGRALRHGAVLRMRYELAEIHEEIIGMNREEDRLLVQRRADCNVFSHRTRIIAMMLCLLVLLALSAVYFGVRLILQGKRRADNEASIANAKALEVKEDLIQNRLATFAALSASEDVLRKQSLELVRSNADLEQFAYVASHDMQEPLRMIGSYLDLLSLEYKDQLSDEAHEYIAYAVDGAVRMKSLIRDLLDYSRVGTQATSMETVAVGSLLKDVLADLQLIIAENEAVVTQDELPNISTDESQLRLVFQNLVGNAIKFRGAEAPRIHISAEEFDREWRFSVKDNGIGISAAQAERIFVIFQRLHAKSKYTGTGIGLSTCKRIVERLGGRIWVESAATNGSTFFLTHPKLLENDHEQQRLLEVA